MKKSSIATALILSLSALSVAYADDSSPFNGYYVNAMVGWQGTSVNGSGTTGQNNIGPIFNLQFQDQITLPIVQNTAGFSNPINSVLGHLGFGYGHVFENHFRLGAEAFIQSSTVSASSNSSTTERTFVQTDKGGAYGYPITTTDTAKFNMNGVEYGVDLMPGYVIGNKQLISGIVGFSLTPSFSVDGTSSGSALLGVPPQGENTPLVSIPGGSLTASSGAAVGFRLGLGYTYQLTQHWNLLANYVHTFYFNASATKNVSYDTVTVNGQTVTYPNVLTESVTAKLLSNNQVLVGVSYNF